MEELVFDKDKLFERYNPLDFAIAYGSGVFKQRGYGKKDKPMIDFIFGIDSTFEWHKINLEKNIQDYSLIAKTFGANFIELFLQHTAAKLYYNSFIDFEGKSIKYGLISQDDFIKDLVEWKELYIAGRLHKPVKILKANKKIKKAIKKNLEHAVNVSLLLLPEKFTEEKLYVTIAGLSYTGDIRMGIGENPKKVTNIVKKNLGGFKELYRDIIKNKSNIFFLNNKIQQDKCPKTQEKIFSKLPTNLKNHMASMDLEFDEPKKRIRKAIADITFLSSITQTIKGLATAGFFKSVKYVSEKLKKRIK